MHSWTLSRTLSFSDLSEFATRESYFLCAFVHKSILDPNSEFHQIQESLNYQLPGEQTPDELIVEYTVRIGPRIGRYGMPGMLLLCHPRLALLSPKNLRQNGQ